MKMWCRRSTRTCFPAPADTAMAARSPGGRIRRRTLRPPRGRPRARTRAIQWRPPRQRAAARAPLLGPEPAWLRELGPASPVDLTTGALNLHTGFLHRARAPRWTALLVARVALAGRADESRRERGHGGGLFGAGSGGGDEDGRSLPSLSSGRRPSPGAGGVFSRPSSSARRWHLQPLTLLLTAPPPASPSSFLRRSAPAARVSYNCSSGWAGLDLARSTPARTPREILSVCRLYNESVVVRSTYENGTLAGDGRAVGGR
jgi:hypothetical protein